ncbi:MAG: polysaccharide deacetylase family protein [Deltaproteobacteria bacterium]|nr:polysaccharide deacetylase family protein [Deltaproteobacteria bacterium]
MGRFVPGSIFVASLALFVVSWTVARGGSSDALHISQVAPTPRAVSTPPIGHLAEPSLTAERVVFGTEGSYKVALTFDDGPHVVHTARLLRILQRHQVTATFFVNGFWLDPKRDRDGVARKLLLRMHQSGHAIGNHTLNHANLSTLTPEEQTWEIVGNDLLISQIIGQRTKLFRAPYGKMTAHVAQLLSAYDYVHARWSATTEEEQRDPHEIGNALMDWIRKHRGGIVLLHDRLPQSVSGVALFLAELDRLNCSRFSSQLPTFRLVSIESFSRSPSHSATRAALSTAEEVAHRRRLQRVCSTLALRHEQAGNR